MPHIHNLPGQIDMTVSAYVVRRVAGEWKCLVHFHKKMEKLMQIGGHIELTETPWQAIAHELTEESGYHPDELEILQWTADRPKVDVYVQHPLPFIMNTHNVGNEHYHSDVTYGFVASKSPKNPVEKGESADLRWLTIAELDALASGGEALPDVANLYHFLLDHINQHVRVPAAGFSLDKPKVPAATYHRGAPGQ